MKKSNASVKIEDLQDFDGENIYRGSDHARADYPKDDKMTEIQKIVLGRLREKKSKNKNSLTPHEESVLFGLEGLAELERRGQSPLK